MIRSPLSAPRSRKIIRFGSRAIALLLAAACADSGTGPNDQQPAPAGPGALGRLTCIAQVREQHVSCAPADSSSQSLALARTANAGIAADVILGGQHTFIELTSTNVAYANDVFSFDATVGNLIGQKLGTTDGTTLAPAGVRVFFSDGPNVTGGTGSIDFLDPNNGNASMVDGTATFTAANQPYYQYNEVLATNQTSSSKQWRIHVPASVTSFSFTVLVSAPVQFPNGWVDVAPTTATIKAGATTQLAATVKDFIGRTIAGSVTWGTNASGVATVDGSGLVTGVADGTATITATSGSATGTSVITVSTTSAANTTITGVPSSQTVGANSTITVQAKNGAGANMTAGGDAVVLTPSGGSLGSVTDNNDGTYTATLTSNTPGTITVTGTINTVAIGHPGSVTFTVGAAGSVVIAAGDAQTATSGAAVAVTPKVTVLDQFGNPVAAGTPVVFTVTGGNGSVIGGSTTTDASGQASPTSWTLGSGGVGCTAIAISNCSRNALTATVTGGSNPAVSFKAYIPPMVDAQSYYQTVGNHTLSIASNIGLLQSAFSINGNGANGSGATLSVTTPTPAGSQSGTATIASNGSFTYLSSPTYVDAAAGAGETFTYAVGDNFASATASATLKVSVPAHVWFVRPGYAGTSTGSDAQPFKDFSTTAGAGVEAAGAATTSDVILVQTGTGTAAGGTILASQTVEGQGAATPATYTPPAGFINTGVAMTLLATGTPPQVDALTVSTGNVLIGMALTTSTGAALSGTNFGTLIVSQMSINATTAEAVSLNTGQLSGSFTSVTSTGGPSNIFLFDVIGAGTVSFGTGTMSGATADAALRLVATQGAFSYAGSVTGNGNGPVVDMAGGSGSFTFTGDLTQGGAEALVSVSNGHTGTLTFNTGTLTATNGTGLVFDNADGTYVFNGPVALGNGAGSISITDGSSGTFTFGTGTAITNTGSSNAVLVDGGLANVTFNGTLVHGTSGSPLSATGIAVTNNTGGTVTFGGSSASLFTTTADAVTLTNNAGATVNFTGGALHATTTSGNTFVATGGGTVSVQGADNTLVSTTGTALNVSNTTIGATGLTFKSISANGGTNGIILNTTGANAGLTVTGDGTNTSQGGNGSGGTIQSLTGADGTTSGTGAGNGLGVGVYLKSTQGVALRRMDLHDFSNFAIDGEGVAGFTLQYSTIGGTNGNSTPQQESAIRFTGLTGTATIDNNTVTGGAYDNIRVDNSSGTLTDLVVTNNIIHDNGATGNDGIGLNLTGGTTTAHITGNTLASNRNDHVGVTVNSAANANLVINGNTTTGGHVAATGQGIAIRSASLYTGALTYDISGNTMNGAVGTAAIATVAGAGTGTFSGQISSNIIGTTAVNGSGSSAGDGILVEQDGSGAHTVSITGNTLRQYFGRGIFVLAANNPGTTGTLDATIVSNTLTERATGGSLAGLEVKAGSGASSANAVCTNIHTNALGGAGANVGAGSEDFFMQQLFGTTLKVIGYTGGTTDNAALVSFLQSFNDGSPTGSAVNSGSGGGFIGGSSCASPTIPS